MLGDEIVDHYRCLQHNAFDDDQLVSSGTTSLGHPVRLNRRLMEADVRILTGFIEPHFFAGFSGGPKGVLPALAGAESVFTNHGREMIAHPSATWGVTRGNPIWEEMLEIALLVQPVFLLNVTLNTRRQITGVFAGDLRQAHAAGCASVRDQSWSPCANRMMSSDGQQWVSADQNLYQTVKA
jgi:nickel-dependent lactate racemase